MNEVSQHFHGSDIEKIEKLYNIDKEKLINFAGNVNPLGISTRLREELSDNIDIITRYPDREYTKLRKSISKYTDVDSNNIIVGNGSSQLIASMIKLINPKKALIIGPTYSEYERELKLNKSKVVYHKLSESDNFILDLNKLISNLQDSIDMLIICNPNNPTSSVIDNEKMKIILSNCKLQGIYVMIDETYVEFVSSLKQITSIPLTDKFDNLIVLRGISKFFAAPGLRLGYAIANQNLIKQINAKKEPWSINSIAAFAGEIMFSDIDYINKTKKLIDAEREKIWNSLKDFKSIKIYYPTANFILVKILKDNITSNDVFNAAIKEGFMVRDLSSSLQLGEKYFRFCFMMPKDNDKLLNIIKTIFS